MNIVLDAKHKSSDNRAMNKLDTKTRAQILAMLCEGASMRSVSRLTGTSINTADQPAKKRSPYKKRAAEISN
jgi:hypothetical protein